MNKLLIIGLGAILLVGGIYEASQTFQYGKDHESSSQNGKSGSPETAAAPSAQSPDQKQADPQTGKTAETNGTQASKTEAGLSTHPKSESTSLAVAPEKPKENCFAFEYRHKKAAQNQDIENFLDYTNAFPLLHANYNPKSLCVKVNQKTVEYQLGKNKSSPEVRVGSVVGPESVIRVSYCVGKVTCHENCAAPKKHFMDDLMNSPGDDEAFGDSWGADTDGKQKEVKAKAKELRAIASESESLNENSIMRDWDTLQKQEWVCKENK